MKKFCGKCGAKLHKPTGLCPQCDKKAVMKYHLKRFGATILIILVLLSVITAWKWNQKIEQVGMVLPSFSTFEATLPSSAPQEDPAEAYLQNEILTRYEGSIQNLEIPYRVFFYVDENRGYSCPFFEIEEEPVALLVTKKSDYNGDGISDLFVVSIDAEAPTEEDRERFTDLNGVCRLSGNIRVLYFNREGEVASTSNGFLLIYPDDNETAKLFQLKNQIVTYHGSSQYLPSSGKEVQQRSEFLSVYDLAAEGESFEQYHAFRVLNCDRNTNIVVGTSYGFGSYEENSHFDYFRSGTLESPNVANTVNTEKEACEKMKSALQNSYGIQNIKFEPYQGKKWTANMFWADESLEQLCGFSIRSTSDADDSEQGMFGIMNLIIENTTIKE